MRLYSFGLAAATLALSMPLAACAGPPPLPPQHLDPPDAPPPPPVVDASSGGPAAWLRSQHLSEQMTDFVSGREVPSGFTSVRRDPGLLLGSIYVIMAKEGKTCASDNPADFEQDRLPDFRKNAGQGCSVVSFPTQTLNDNIVKGSVKGDLEIVVGKGQVEAEATYELKYEDVATAAFDSPRACIDTDAMKKFELPARTCVARYISGAVLTDITWRSYRAVKAGMEGSYMALIKVGADTMGSTDSLKLTPIISVDSVNTGMYEAGTDGFLHLKKDATVDPATKIGGPKDRLDPRWSKILLYAPFSERKIDRAGPATPKPQPKKK